MYITGTLFFFQAEDGIRDGHVTGVQTCALPIYPADNRQGFIACRKSEAPKKIAWQGGCSRFCVSNTITWRRTVAGAVYTIETSRTFQQQGETDKAFIYTDHLGSTDLITDKGGNVIQSMSFNAWGQRRDADSWDLVTDVIAQRFTERTSRGYTSHEQLDEVGLIHMNGRIYDPRLARFLQADPFIQAPGNTQSYNRYSYLWNNPLNATDPSGFILKKLWDNIRPVVGAIVAAVLCYAANCLGSTEAMIWIGGVSGAVGAAANGADTSGIMLGAMTGMASGANIYLGAIVAGVSAHAQGGSFGRTFVAAGVGAIVGRLDLNGLNAVVVSTGAGGERREITGGKFKNGASTAAFSWSMSRRVQTIRGGPHDQCSAALTCTELNFSEAQKKEILKNIEALAVDTKAGEYAGVREAAQALDNNKALTAYAEELGIEFWAVIDKESFNIKSVGTGFRSSNANGVYGPTSQFRPGDSVWHTHPSGADVWPGDLGSIADSGGRWMFASGRRLTGIDLYTTGYSSSRQIRGDWGRGNVTMHVYENGSWGTEALRF